MAKKWGLICQKSQHNVDNGIETRETTITVETSFFDQSTMCVKYLCQVLIGLTKI